MPVLNLLQKNLLVKSKGLNEICEKNRYTLQFLLTMAELKRANKLKEDQVINSSDSEDGSDNDHSQHIEDMELESKWDNESE
jgi:hypothetical protein